MSTLLIAPPIRNRRCGHSIVVPRPPCERCNSDDWPQSDERPEGLPEELPEDGSDLDDSAGPTLDDDRWDVFLPDDEPYESNPEPGDFWIDAEEE